MHLMTLTVMRLWFLFLWEKSRLHRGEQREGKATCSGWMWATDLFRTKGVRSKTGFEGDPRQAGRGPIRTVSREWRWEPTAGHKAPIYKDRQRQQELKGWMKGWSQTEAGRHQIGIVLRTMVADWLRWATINTQTMMVRQNVVLNEMQDNIRGMTGYCEQSEMIISSLTLLQKPGNTSALNPIHLVRTEFSFSKEY